MLVSCSVKPHWRVYISYFVVFNNIMVEVEFLTIYFCAHSRNISSNHGIIQKYSKYFYHLLLHPFIHLHTV